MPGVSRLVTTSDQLSRRVTPAVLLNLGPSKPDDSPEFVCPNAAVVDEPKQPTNGDAQVLSGRGHADPLTDGHLAWLGLIGQQSAASPRQVALHEERVRVGCPSEIVIASAGLSEPGQAVDPVGGAHRPRSPVSLPQRSCDQARLLAVREA